MSNTYMVQRIYRFSRCYIELETSHPHFVEFDKYTKERKTYAPSCNIKPPWPV